jgi:hypothetical protein
MKLKFLILIFAFAINLPAQSFLQQNDEKVYTVIKGDCLWKISKMNFASGKFWPEIWVVNKEGVVNKEKIDNPVRKSIPNPNLIYPGQVLNIPKIRNLNEEQLKSAYKEARKRLKEYKKNKSGAKENKVSDSKEQNKK